MQLPCTGLATHVALQPLHNFRDIVPWAIISIVCKSTLFFVNHQGIHKKALISVLNLTFGPCLKKQSTESLRFGGYTTHAALLPCYE